jgi:hypothetical protein
MLAMLIHPEVQERARIEIDAVIGRDRPPSFEDRPRLPYVEAILMEVLRWKPIAPQGLCFYYTGEIKTLTRFGNDRYSASCGRGRHLEQLLHS